MVEYHVGSCAKCPFLGREENKVYCALNPKLEMDDEMIDDLPEECILREGLKFVSDPDYDDDGEEEQEDE